MCVGAQVVVAAGLPQMELMSFRFMKLLYWVAITAFRPPFPHPPKLLKIHDKSSLYFFPQN